MRKLLLVARHEFLTHLRRPGFLFASFGIPALIAVLWFLIFNVAIQVEGDTARIGTVGYVDMAGVLAGAVDQPPHFRAFADAEAARADLDARAIGAYFVVPADYLDTGTVRLYSVEGAPAATQDEIDAFLVANLGARLGDEALVRRIVEPADLAVRTLDSGRTLREGAMIVLFLMPLLFVMVVMLSSQITSGYLMSGVVEEKTNRVMEVLVTSVTPFQLLGGKIIGLGALGLVQLVIWVVMGAVGLRLGQNAPFLQGIELPADMVIVAVVFFLLSYLLYASFSAGVGAVIGSEQESRQFAGFFSFLMMVPFFFMLAYIENPNGPLPIALTLFPLTAPVSVMMRMGFTVVPAEQLVLSMAILLFTALIVAWASARLFRWSMLRYGKAPGLRDVLRAIARGPRPADALAKESAR